MNKLLYLGFIALVALACKKHQSDATPGASASAAAAPVASSTELTAELPPADADAATAAPVAANAPAASPTQVPAQEDFEKKATTDITAANAAQQLTQIEKEIGQ